MTRRQFHEGKLAAALVLASAVALVGLTRFAPLNESQGATVLVLVTAGIVLAALPGTVMSCWSAFGRMILWSASGWCLMLLLGGIFSFGALMALPLALIVLGLVTWPRAEGQPFVSWPDVFAHAGGFGALFVALIASALVR
jgi:hypothetical protein